MSSKRAPSQYNIFVKEYLASHKGANFKDAAAAWKHKKTGKNKPEVVIEVIDIKNKKSKK